jgi:peptidoglycan/LPS O-acetylase OafA/YrhL
MWFAETLIVFGLGYMLLRRVRGTRATAPGTPAPPAVPQRPATPLTATLALVGGVAALAVATYLWRLLVPSGSYWPVVGLPTPYFLPQYVALFALGAVAYRRRWFDRLPRAAGWAGLAAAAVTGAAYAAAALLVSGADVPAWQMLLHALLENAFAAAVIVALIVLFREVANRRGRVSAFLADHAFAVYFVHPVVLVLLSYALRGWEAVAVVKFGAVTLLALPLCWGAAYLIRRVPGARRVF